MAFILVTVLVDVLALGLIIPVRFTQVFAFSIRPHRGLTLPGAPFLLGAALMALAWGAAWRSTRPAPPAGA